MDRYLLRCYLAPFGYCLAAFILVMLIYDFSINLEDFIDGKVRLDVILEYFIYSLPMKISDVIPMASLLSVLFCIGQLKKHNEILALQASGISLLRIMVPFMCFGLAISATVLVLNETLVPHCRQRVAKIETVYMKKGDAAAHPATASVFAFYNLHQQRSWVGVLDRSRKKLLRVEIREFDGDNVAKKMTAEEAEPTAEGWKLNQGKLWEYRDGKIVPQGVQSFETRVFAFPETLKDLLDSQRDTQFMSARELRKHIRIHPKHSRVYHEERVDYYHKWAYPLLNFLVMLMGVPAGLKADKGHFLVGIGTSLGLFLAYYGVNLVSIALGKNEVIAAWLGAWFPSILFGFIGVILIKRTK